MTKFKLRKKVTKINLMITAKHHAHIQSLTKHLQSLKRIRELRLQDTQCLHALSPKMTMS